MRFNTEITLTGPFRRPAQMLEDQEYDGHASVHDDVTAASMGLAGPQGGGHPQPRRCRRHATR